MFHSNALSKTGEVHSFSELPPLFYKEFIVNDANFKQQLNAHGCNLKLSYIPQDWSGPTMQLLSRAAKAKVVEFDIPDFDFSDSWDQISTFADMVGEPFRLTLRSTGCVVSEGECDQSHVDKAKQVPHSVTNIMGEHTFEEQKTRDPQDPEWIWTWS